MQAAGCFSCWRFSPRGRQRREAPAAAETSFAQQQLALSAGKKDATAACTDLVGESRGAPSEEGVSAKRICFPVASCIHDALTMDVQEMLGAFQATMASCPEVLPIIVLETILPLPLEWMPMGNEMRRALTLAPLIEDTEQVFPSPALPSAQQRPRCWDLRRPEQVLHKDQWPDGDIAELERFFCDPQWALPRHIREAMQGFDMVVPPWTPFDLEAGAQMKRVTFSMPLPEDVPKAATALVNLPEFVTVEVYYYFRRRAPAAPGQATPLVLCWESQTEGAPFSEKYCILGTMEFCAGADGKGVDVVAWSEVHWFEDLPWGLDLVRIALEMMVRREAVANLTNLASNLGRGSGCLC